jgi:hypothetical protein
MTHHITTSKTHLASKQDGQKWTRTFYNRVKKKKLMKGREMQRTTTERERKRKREREVADLSEELGRSLSSLAHQWQTEINKLRI